MAVTPEELGQTAPGAPTIRAPLHPFRVLPGGSRPIPEEVWAGGILLVALGLLWAMRRNLDHDPTHVHAGGTSAIVFLLYYLIVTALLRIAAGELAHRSETRPGLEPVAAGVAFFA